MSDLKVRAIGLLDFALDSVAEGSRDRAQSAECYMEADNAIRILKKMLLKEDQVLHAQLALMSIFDASFCGMDKNENRGERDAYFKDAVERIAFAKTLF